ncbi:hypothetical protein DFS34DRAFT_230936 [Phlyctochytrium arcticum]|nr:hypothetical protein DFS34DRAFT_230936 [Phlyctochytrium arcticum]
MLSDPSKIPVGMVLIANSLSGVANPGFQSVRRIRTYGAKATLLYYFTRAFMGILLSLLVSYLALVLARPQKISRRQGSVGQDCGNGTSTLQLTQFQFQPYPLQPGANTTLTIAGTLSKPIEQGATALVSVTAGQGPPLFNNTIDLCQLAAQARICLLIFFATLFPTIFSFVGGISLSHRCWG